MINYNELEGKTLGIAFWQKNDQGDDDVIMASGRCFLIGTMIYMRIGEIEKDVPILKVWADRIEPLIDESIKRIFHNSDFGLSLAVADMPQEADMNYYKPLGLKI